MNRFIFLSDNSRATSSCVRSGLTIKLTDRHELTYESQKLQGKTPSANGGSVQRIVELNPLRG